MCIIGHNINESIQTILSYIFFVCEYILMKKSCQMCGKKFNEDAKPERVPIFLYIKRTYTKNIPAKKYLK